MGRAVSHVAVLVRYYLCIVSVLELLLPLFTLLLVLFILLLFIVLSVVVAGGAVSVGAGVAAALESVVVVLSVLLLPHDTIKSVAAKARMPNFNVFMIFWFFINLFIQIDTLIHRR